MFGRDECQYLRRILILNNCIFYHNFCAHECVCVVFQAEAPYFKITPEGVVKVAEGQDTMLKCHAFGAPKPIIVWTKDNELLSRERFIKEDSGNLKILVCVSNSIYFYINRTDQKIRNTI